MIIGSLTLFLLHGILFFHGQTRASAAEYRHSGSQKPFIPPDAAVTADCPGLPVIVILIAWYTFSIICLHIIQQRNCRAAIVFLLHKGNGMVHHSLDPVILQETDHRAFCGYIDLPVVHIQQKKDSAVVLPGAVIPGLIIFIRIFFCRHPACIVRGHNGHVHIHLFPQSRNPRFHLANLPRSEQPGIVTDTGTGFLYLSHG